MIYALNNLFSNQIILEDNSQFYYTIKPYDLSNALGNIVAVLQEYYFTKRTIIVVDFPANTSSPISANLTMMQFQTIGTTDTNPADPSGRHQERAAVLHAPITSGRLLQGRLCRYVTIALHRL